ncbi:MAG: Cysteine--tRNA ligase [Chlamydiia bacterium]|nr:Cysteine--tRNA ligase [Chlamydiia bacterium]
MGKELLNLYDTQSRQQVSFPFEMGREVKLYTCGPTVYNRAHIGNLRTYVFEDLLHRSLNYFGHTVNHVMNITDVDDKTIKKALDENKGLNELTQPYIDGFFEDLDALKIKRATTYPRATEYVGQMIEMIAALMEKGCAYQGGDGSVFFRIDAFKEYGKLSGLDLSDLKAGASNRVASDEYDKENVQDFVLWKAYDQVRDGEVFWESPFGKGRPGWHIECSAMAYALLGESIDLHCGGCDNKFPHHENEIAQSESFTNQPFVKLWMHSEHLIVEGAKMSKSLGNFLLLEDLLKEGFSPAEVRYLLISVHYRSQLNFTREGLLGARSALQRIGDCVVRLSEIAARESELDGVNDAVQDELKLLIGKFNQGLKDDLNISLSLGALFEAIKEINIFMQEGLIGPNDAKDCLDFLRGIDQVLAIIPFDEKVEGIPKEVQLAFEVRQQARREKNFQLADEKRNYIASQGYVIEDTREGARLKKGS